MNYTNINQSKSLVELGIDSNTADMYYYDYEFQGALSVFNKSPVCTEYKNHDDNIPTIPCWSTGALIDLLPKIIVNNNHNYYLDIDVNSAMPVYSYDNFNHYLYGFPNDFLGGDLISNLIKCIEWLKEHNLM